MKKILVTLISALILFGFPIIALGYDAEQTANRELIIQAATEYGVDVDLALAIADCESKFRTVKNKYSSATGVYQFLIGSWYHYGDLHWGDWEGHTRWNPEHNIELAMRVMKSSRGTKDWNASAYCWRPKLAVSSTIKVALLK